MKQPIGLLDKHLHDETLKDYKIHQNPNIYELPMKLQRDCPVKTDLLLIKEIKIQYQLRAVAWT